MKILTYSFLIVILSINSLIAIPPVNTPAHFGGIDTLTKMSRINALRAGRELSKNTNDQIQGTLIEDPRVIFSTYCGGNGYDCGNSLAVDSHGDVYIVGYTGSTNFPVSDDAWQKEKRNGHDMFVGKFTASGERVWLTHFGGNGTDVAVECISDKDDNLIIVGKTDSPDFPTTEGVEQPTHQGSIDVVLVKFAPDGKLIWSRYYGGYNGEVGEGIALCGNGTDFVITGSTLSMNKIKSEPGLPITKGTYQDTLATYNATTLYYHPDAFLAKFDGDGKMIWGTYFGGVMDEVAHAVAVDKDDNIAIVGEVYRNDIFTTPVFPTTPDAFRRDSCAGKDIFYSKFSPQGALVYSTYYCGSTGNPNDETKYPDDYANDVKFDSEGNSVFCGYTGSKLFPTTPDAYKPKYDSFDAVLVKYGKDNKRIWSTYFGGASGSDFANSLAIDSNNNFWIGGESTSPDLFLSDDAIMKRIPNDPFTECFISKIDKTSKTKWTSIYGFPFCYKLTLINDERIIITGETSSPKFPVTKNAFQFNIDLDNYSYTNYLVHIDLNKSIGIDEQIECGDIIIYPNPVDDVFSISIEHDEKLIIRIYNVVGEKIIEKNSQDYNTFPLTIDTSWFSIGMYFITISTNKKQCTIPFIKN